MTCRNYFNVRSSWCARLCLVPTWVLILPTLAFTEGRGAFDPGLELKRQGCAEIELRRTAEHHLFVFGQVNGRQRSVLVDTGWSLTTVAKRSASKLKTPAQLGLKSTDTFFSANEQSAMVMIETLKLGRVTLTNQPAVERDLTFGGQPAPFEVVLGCDFLLRHRAIIDCGNGRLFLRTRAPEAAGTAGFSKVMRDAGYSPVELKIIPRPLAMVCNASLNQTPLRLLVDTAAVWSCVDTRAAEQLGLKLSPTPRRISGVGKTGIRHFAVTTADSLSFGDATINRVNLAVFDLAAWGLAEPDTALGEVRGILGGPELAERQAIIDCGQRTLWLKTTPKRK